MLPRTELSDAQEALGEDHALANFSLHMLQGAATSLAFTYLKGKFVFGAAGSLLSVTTAFGPALIVGIVVVPFVINKIAEAICFADYIDIDIRPETKTSLSMPENERILFQKETIEEYSTRRSKDMDFSLPRLVGTYAMRLYVRDNDVNRVSMKAFMDYLQKDKVISISQKDVEIFDWYKENILERLDILHNVYNSKQVLAEKVLAYITTDNFKKHKVDNTSTPSVVRSTYRTVSKAIEKSKDEKNQLEKERIIKKAMYITGGTSMILSAAFAVPTNGLSLFVYPLVTLIAPLLYMGNSRSTETSISEETYIEEKEKTPSENELELCVPVQEVPTGLQKAGKEAFEYIANICTGSHPDLDIFSEDEKEKIQELVQTTVDSYCEEVKKMKVETQQAQSKVWENRIFSTTNLGRGRG